MGRGHLFFHANPALMISYIPRTGYLQVRLFRSHVLTEKLYSMGGRHHSSLKNGINSKVLELLISFQNWVLHNTDLEIQLFNFWSD